MEKLVDLGLLESVIDITTTEVADHLFGGILPCTEDRFGSIIRMKIPYVGSVGAVDMVNFGARERYRKHSRVRKFSYPQSAGDADADNACGKSRHWDLDCRAA